MTRRRASPRSTSKGHAPRRRRTSRTRGTTHAAGKARGARPLVAIVGRPNVGKSTLFNRLAGTRLALMDDRAGVTRDLRYADAEINDRPIILVDTGGFDPDARDNLHAAISEQVKVALEECDLVLCVLDATSGVLPADREAVSLLRRAPATSGQKPVIYLANKADSERRRMAALDLHELGVGEILPVSAAHGHGLGELEDAIAARLPEPDPPSESEAETKDAQQAVARVAIIGRPNAGKSSLVNRLAGEARHLVDDQPGTTMDSIDSWIDHNGTPLVLVDTAGMRRKRSVKHGLESLAVLQATRALERSDVAVLVIDAVEGAKEQDAKIANLAIERGTGFFIAINKADRLTRDELAKATTQVREALAFADWAPVITTSALNGRGMQKLVQTVRTCTQARAKRVTTGELNRFFEQIIDRNPPPTYRKRPVKLYYTTQVRAEPPTFVVKANNAQAVRESYRRYVVNQLRERFGFEGTPIRVLYRKRESEGRKR